MSAWHRYFDAEVPVARLRLFSTFFLLLLAFDACFVMSWRGFAYGEAGFNVAHFAWLDAIQPLPSSASYIGLLLLAGREGEAAVDAALRQVIDQGRAVTVQAVEAFLQSEHLPNPVVDVVIPAVDLRAYDALLTEALSC